MTFKKIAEFLSRNGWKAVFRKIEGNSDGLAEYDKKRISIHSRICREVADTMIHEYLHAKHSDWSEKKVRRETKKIINRMSEQKIVRMAKKIFKTVPLE